MQKQSGVIAALGAALMATGAPGGSAADLWEDFEQRGRAWNDVHNQHGEFDDLTTEQMAAVLNAEAQHGPAHGLAVARAFMCENEAANELKEEAARC